MLIFHSVLIIKQVHSIKNELFIAQIITRILLYGIISSNIKITTATVCSQNALKARPKKQHNESPFSAISLIDN